MIEKLITEQTAVVVLFFFFLKEFFVFLKAKKENGLDKTDANQAKQIAILKEGLKSTNLILSNHIEHLTGDVLDVKTELKEFKQDIKEIKNDIRDICVKIK